MSARIRTAQPVRKLVSLSLSLGAFALLLVSATPARAQGNHWAVSYATTGSFPWSDVVNGQPYSGVKPLSHHLKFGGRSGCTSVTADMDVTVTATLTWVDTYGQPITPGPSEPQYFKETPDAYADTLGWETSYSATADDGAGDPAVDDNGIVDSTGQHLIMRNGSSGTITLVRHLTAHFHSEELDGSNYCMLDWAYSVVPDTRGVEITSTVDLSFRRDFDANGDPVPAPNFPDDAGVTTADTVCPLGDNLVGVTYTATPAGNWGQDSPYWWYAGLMDVSSNGTFSPSAIDPLLVIYSSDKATPGAYDHVFIHCRDSSDGANATNNYYLNFHWPYEDWQNNDGYPKRHPDEFTGLPAPDGWYEYTFADNPTDHLQSSPVTVTWGQQETTSGTIGSQVVTQFTDPAGFISMQANWSVTSTSQVNCSVSQQMSMNVSPHTELQLWLAIAWWEYQGTTSVWGYHGYGGDVDTWAQQYMPGVAVAWWEVSLP